MRRCIGDPERLALPTYAASGRKLVLSGVEGLAPGVWHPRNAIPGGEQGRSLFFYVVDDEVNFCQLELVDKNTSLSPVVDYEVNFCQLT